MALWPAIIATDYDPESPITTGLMGNIIDRTNLNYGSHFVVKKSGDEPVNNSVVLQNDDDFTWAIGAADIWCYRLVLHLTGSAINVGFRFNWSLPALATVGGSYFTYEAVAGMTAQGHTTFAGDLVVTPTGGVQFALDLMTIEGYIDNTAGGAGTAVLQWAQDFAAGTSTLSTHSTLRAHQQTDTI